MQKFILSITFYFLIGGSSLGQTSFTAIYNLGGSGNDVTNFPYNGTNYSGIIMGDLIKNGITSTSSNGNFRGSNWPLGATNGSNIFLGSVDPLKYISFSIAPASGYSYSVSSITFGIGRSLSGPRQWEWRGSLDSYSTILNNYTFVNDSLINDLGVLTTPDANGAYYGNILDVSTAYNDLIVTSEFRLYGFNSENVVGTGGLQGNITITGTFNFDVPVELTSFVGSVKSNKVKLNWETATEVNNYGFEIERTPASYTLQEFKPDNYLWESIGFVSGNGNSNSPKHYSFIDDDIVLTGRYLYRLKQIDTDGQFKYSQLVEISFTILDDFTLEQNYPNPFNPSTRIKYTIPSSAAQSQNGLFVTLKIYDVLGDEIASLVSEYQQPGTYEAEFFPDDVNANAISSGVYFYQLKAGDFIKNKKMILLR